MHRLKRGLKLKPAGGRALGSLGEMTLSLFD
jgi:hypothetical protein